MDYSPTLLKQSPELASAQIWVVMAIANSKLDSWAAAGES